MRIYGVVLIVASAFTLAAQTPDVSGTWLSDSNANQKWVLDQKDGKVHQQELKEGGVEADFTCSLSGEECKAKEDGHSEKIMMYFNGTKLVEICERENGSIKKWLIVSPDGKTLTVETVPLSTSQKSEKISFHRQTA